MADSKAKKQLLRVFEQPGFTWVDIAKPSLESLEQLKSRFPYFLDIDLRDCLPPFQRPKLLLRDKYLFMVLLFPVFNTANRTIESAELDIFVGPGFVVTNHDGRLKTLTELSDCFSGKKAVCTVEEISNPANWLHAALSGLLISCFPMLTHISNDIAALESALFKESDGNTVREILRVKSNIVDFRKIMQGHKHIIEKFMVLAPKILSMEHLEVYYEDLVGHTKEIWDFLDTDKNTIDAVYESYLSLITYQTSEATKTLTALAFIIFPMTLAAAIFAMRAEHMPLVGLPGDFWFMLGVVFLVMAGTVGWLRSKKWL